MKNPIPLLTLTALLAGFVPLGAGELPVVPAPVKWESAGGDSRIDGRSWSYGDDSLEPVIGVLREELPGATFTKQPRPSAGGIHLALAKSVGPAGAYRIEIGEHAEVTAATPDAVFHATRTLMQLLSSGAKLPTGTITDHPAYGVRSLLLDVGRKFATVDELKDWIRLLAWFRFNELHLHLNDNSWGRYPGYRLESRAFPAITSKDGHYTWEEIRGLQDFAKARGITIIPEIDAPGHSLAFTAAYPSLAHPEINREGFGLAYLDVRNPDAIRFMEQLLDEVVPLFDAPQFHIGTDEYRINLIKDPQQRTECGELFRKWINHFAGHLETRHGKRTRIWSGYEHLPGTTEPRKDIIIDMWETSDAKAKSAAGYHFVNSSHFFTYIVPGAPYYGVNNAGVYQDWTPRLFARQEGAILDEGDPGLLGGKLHVWNDFGPTGYTWNEIARLTLPSLEAFSEKLWGTKASANHEDFRKRCDAIGHGVPGVTMLERSAAPGSGEVVWKLETEAEFIANSTLEIGKGDLEWPWTASFTVLRKNDIAGDEVLVGSELATFYLDLSRMVGEKGKESLKRGVACVRANQAPGYDPLTSYNPDILIFDYQIPVGKETQLTFVGEERRTSLCADGKLIGTIGKQMICPLGRIGAQKLPNGFHGTLTSALVKSAAPVRKEVGTWEPDDFEGGSLRFEAKLPEGTTSVSFNYLRGTHGVEIRDVGLVRDGKVFHGFEGEGFAGGRPVGNVFEVPAGLRDGELTIRATLTGRDGTDSAGRVEAVSGL